MTPSERAARVYANARFAEAIEQAVADDRTTRPATMARADAIVILNEGVYRAWDEGCAGDELIAASRTMIAHFGVRRDDVDGVACFDELWDADWTPGEE